MNYLSRISAISGMGILIMLSACNLDLGERGNGQIITESRETSDFEEIELLGNFRITLQQSDDPGVVITTDENLMDHIQVETIGRSLKISSDKKIRPSDRSEIIINYKSVDLIEVSGAASLRANETVNGDYLKISMSGAGEVDMRVDLGKLDLDISGAGAVKLQGSAEEQSISMSGAGGYDGDKLESKSCRVSISGVGGAKVYVTQDLFADVSGIGGVSYSGNPKNVQSNVSGLGSVSEDKDGRDPS
ncbi:head GIN domain-containing protein [Fulvivirga sedimenti]|jgi:hypothetical protein|uniref:DUF2807 domain-containing protein n=1 Tax=Fulvivirga sedimenti TaxID=2879465 RepID=A0A9X1KXQ9_9BACT|nr:head GIN domain-containing protein [Fulvivirga sedimenti]MCA6074432.1 DUF2807 domain-containing protein [Fulvivirga sedimenti]